MGGVEVRPARPGDHTAIHGIEAAAFGQPDEADLVDRLRADGEAIVELVAELDGVLVGHILFTRLKVEPPARFAAMAPVAVAPSHQSRGVGAALVKAGVEACRDLGEDAVIVLGHPEYYPRFGFSAEAASTVASPFDGPAFMALALTDGALDRTTDIRYPAAFGL